MRAHAVKNEPPSSLTGYRFELAPDPVAPRVVHAEHGGVGRQAQPSPRPGFLDDLPLERQLVLVFRVLELAPATRAEVRTWRGHAVRRRFDHPCRGGHGHPSLPAARLGLDDLARQREVHQPYLAVVPRNGRAAVRRRSRPEDQRRHNAIGSCAGLKPAASTIWVARLKPSATLSGWCASLPYCTTCPPTSRHQRTTVMSGLRMWPRVVLTSSTRPVAAAALRTARISPS